MHARLQRGKTSRINADFHELASGLYPPNYWREGDYILHRQEFEVPVLEILSGTHDLVVAMRRGRDRNIRITDPEGKRGPLGVRIKNDAHTYAVIGQVEVW